jgi:hypothetical protein
MNNLTVEQINDLFTDPIQFQDMFIDILSEVSSPITIKICEKLKQGQVDVELDKLLRLLGMTPPYSFLVPTLRQHLKFTIDTEAKCITSLEQLKPNLSADDISIINGIIEFIKGDDGIYEIDENKPDPIEALLSIIPKLNIEERTIGLNCLEYLVETITPSPQVEDPA